MTIDSLEIFLNWMTQHTVWVNIFIFIIAMSESLLVVGLIVPGFLLMVGFGALIATGHLEFWSTTLIATAGAITGDGLSYWLGQHYKLQLQRMWPLSRYPSLILQGTQFFDKHGKKSVVLGRFFGPLRAIVPTIAGISNMPAPQFYVSNILSAIAWAPLYLLPGILFGMSLQLAKEFAGQLAFIIVITIILILVIIQVIRILYGWLAPQADVLSYRLIIWARQHPIVGSLPDGLVNPKHSEVRAISIFATLLVLSAIALIIFNHYLFNTLFLNNIDSFIQKQFILLQHPFITKIATFINLFSHHNFIFSTVALFSIWNFYFKNYKSILFIIATLLLPWSYVFLINFFSLSSNIFTQQAHSATNLFIVAISVYGFIAIYIAKSLSNKPSRLVYTVFFIFASLIAFSQLYLNQQVFSNLLGHFLFGSIWFSILGIAYRRHPLAAQNKLRQISLTTKFITTVSIAALAIIFVKNIELNKTEPLKQQPGYIMGYDAWLESGWNILPAFRNDIRAQHRQPLNIQWIASKEAIIRTLNTSNWQQEKNTAKKYSNWFKNTSNPTDLPIVKHIHNGQYNTLTFMKTMQGSRLAILRLWSSDYYTQSKDSKTQLWIGEISFTKIKITPLLTYLTTIPDFKDTINFLTADLSATYELRTKPLTSKLQSNWDGKIILIK